MLPIRIIMEYLVLSCEVLQKVFDRAAATNTEFVMSDVLTTEQTKSITQVLAMWTKLIGSLAVVYETAVSCFADDSAAI